MPSNATSSDLVRVLLVDDNEPMLARAAAVLTPACAVVGTARDGPSALEAASVPRTGRDRARHLHAGHDRARGCVPFAPGRLESRRGLPDRPPRRGFQGGGPVGWRYRLRAEAAARVRPRLRLCRKPEPGAASCRHLPDARHGPLGRSDDSEALRNGGGIVRIHGPRVSSELHLDDRDRRVCTAGRLGTLCAPAKRPLAV